MRSQRRGLHRRGDVRLSGQGRLRVGQTPGASRGRPACALAGVGTATTAFWSLPVSGDRKPRTQPRPEQRHVCDVRPIWTPWGWAVDRKRLLWLIDNWCTGNRPCFSCLINTRFHRTRRELCSRCSAAFRTSATTSAKTGGLRTGIGRTIGGRGWRDGCRPPSIRHRMTAPRSKGRIGPRQYRWEQVIESSSPVTVRVQAASEIPGSKVPSKR